MNRNTNISKTNGLTLIELLIATFILTIGISSILLFFVRSMASSRQSWDYSRAAMHAEYLLEDMQARSSVSDITGVNWTDWAVQENLNSLSEENIEVTFPQVAANWLEILVRVSWMQKDRPEKYEVKTSMKK